jgi:hypothetical protein
MEASVLLHNKIAGENEEISSSSPPFDFNKDIHNLLTQDSLTRNLSSITHKISALSVGRTRKVSDYEQQQQEEKPIPCESTLMIDPLLHNYSFSTPCKSKKPTRGSRGVKRGSTSSATSINLSSTTVLFSPCQRTKVARLTVNTTHHHSLLDFSTIFNTSSRLLGKQRNIVHPCFTPVKSDRTIRANHCSVGDSMSNTSSMSSTSSSHFSFVSPLEEEDDCSQYNAMPTDCSQKNKTIVQPKKSKKNGRPTIVLGINNGIHLPRIPELTES